MWYINKLQNEIGETTREAIQKRFGTKYTVGSISDTICK